MNPGPNLPLLRRADGKELDGSASAPATVAAMTLIDWPNLLTRGVLTVVAGLIVYYLKRRLDRRATRSPVLNTFFGHVASFNVTPPGAPMLTVNTHAVVIRNVSDRVLTNVRLHHNVLPNVTIWPITPWTRQTLQGGTEDIVIPTIQPGQELTVSYLNFPPLLFTNINAGIDCDQGPAQEIPVLLQRVLPEVDHSHESGNTGARDSHPALHSLSARPGRGAAMGMGVEGENDSHRRDDGVPQHGEAVPEGGKSVAQYPLADPIYFLFAHTVELALKAFLLFRGETVPTSGRDGHDLRALHTRCAALGLTLGPDEPNHLPNVVNLLSQENDHHGFRYFNVDKGGAVPELPWTRDVVNRLIQVIRAEVGDGETTPPAGQKGKVVFILSLQDTPKRPPVTRGDSGCSTYS